MKIYLLDVGEQQYGDCILVVHEDRRILIDGGHPADGELISEQLRRLLGAAPHRIDLLIVTHCHTDHYGCLPELVESEVIDVQRALVADETLGWPRSRPRDDGPEDDVASPTMGSARQILNDALLEEPLTDATDEEIVRFLEDAASGEEKYKGMLDAIPRVTRYGTASNQAIRGIEREFESFGLKVLGPTRDHLEICADFIRQESRRRRREDGPESDEMASPADLVDSYRRAVSRKLAVMRGEADAIDAEDRMGAGSARNNQSIVIKVSADGFSALLAGDMQFAAAEVPGLDDSMTTLREKVRATGPYDFVKLTHHTSYNGVDDSVLGDYPGCRNFAHTGGLYDPTHPDPGVLEILTERADDIYFARTDRNGLITITKSGDRMRMQVERGELNNFQRNRRRPRRDDVPQGGEEKPAAVVTERWDREYVEVTAKIPHRATRVTVTIEVDPEKKN